MFRKNIARQLKGLALGVVLVTGLSACGSSTNNDFGTAFTHLGYFPADTEIPACGSTPDEGLAGATVPLNDGGATGEGVTAGAPQTRFVVFGVQSNLTQVGMVGGEVRYSFSIPGSGLSIPSTSLPLAVTLGPAAESGLDGLQVPASSSLPAGFEGICNATYVNFPLLPSDIQEFLNFNLPSLPELPFFMTVTTSVTAVTTAGDFVETNERTIPVEIISSIGIPPTSGV